MPDDNPTKAQMQIDMIELTGDPLAGIVLAKNHDSLGRVMRMLSGICDKTIVLDLEKQLLDAFGTDEELDRLSALPEFSMALAMALSEALVRFTVHTSKRAES